MAKRQNKEQSNGKGKLRVFFAEFEGNDETIQEGLKAIASAVNKTFEPQQQIIRTIETSRGSPVDPNIEEPSEDIDSIDIEHESDDSTPAKPRRQRKAPTMTIVKDLNLRPNGKKSLRDFFEEKSPQSQYSEIAVFLYYLQIELELQEITPNHIFTCYKDVSKRSPKDLPQSIRNTASNKGWVDSSNKNDLKITNHGENHVEHDLPGSDE